MEPTIGSDNTQTAYNLLAENERLRDVIDTIGNELDATNFENEHLKRQVEVLRDWIGSIGTGALAAADIALAAADKIAKE